MEFSNNIKFNDYLAQNQKLTITYTGYLFQNGSESVSIVYGFEEGWKETSEKQMTKTDDGFVAEIEIKEYNLLNFCFKNSNQEWDNNYSRNYTSPIFNSTSTNFILNEDFLDILLNDFEKCLDENVQKIEEITNQNTEEKLNQNIEQVENQNIETIHEQEIISAEETETNFNMDSLIDEILSPIVNSSVEQQPSIISNISDEKADFFNEGTIIPNEASSQEKEVQNNLTNEPVSVDNIKNDNTEISISDSLNENEFKEISIENEILEDSFDAISLERDFDEVILSDEEVNQNNEIDFKENVNEISSNDESDLDELFVLNTFDENPVELFESNVQEINIEDNKNKVENKIENNEETEQSTSVETSLNEIIEESLIDVLNDSNNQDFEENSEEKALIVSPRSLSKFYLFKKKVKIAFCKIFSIIPKLLERDPNENE